MFKKHTLGIAILILLGLRGLAQPDSGASFRERALYQLRPLLEKGLIHAPIPEMMPAFSGILRWTGDSIPDTCTSWQAIQGLAELREGFFSGTSPVPSDLPLLTWRNQVANGQIPSLLVRFPVQVFDTTRLIDSSLYLTPSGQWDWSPTSGSPFLNREVRLGSVLALQNLERGRLYHLLYPRIFTSHPRGHSLNKVEVQIGTGSWTSLNPGNGIPVSFTQNGLHRISFRAVWGDGASLMTQSVVVVNSACADPNYFNRPDDCASWANQFPPTGSGPLPIQASIPFQNLTGKAEVYYYRRNGANSLDFASEKIHKPVILVDGIDFEDSRKGPVLFGKYLQVPGMPESTGNLGRRLQQAGHDVIILNFPSGIGQHGNSAVQEGRANSEIDGGCDYIERNAMVLVELIRRTRLQMENQAEGLVVVGPSMGGILARYALAYMEKNQTQTGPHGCRLFVSQDAPHLGANVPVGIQSIIEDMGGYFNVAMARDYLQNRLKQPATRQLMLANREMPGFKAHALRQTFLQNQAQNGVPGSMGWPLAPGLTRIAIHNGSLSGKSAQASLEPPSRVSGGSRALELEFRMSPWASRLFFGWMRYLSNFQAQETRVIWHVNYAPGNGETKDVLFRGVRGKFQYWGDAWAFKSTHSSPAFSAGISLDEAPGGLYNAPEQVYQETLGNPLGFLNLFQVNAPVRKSLACFIPTQSALAYRWNKPGELSNMAENLRDRNLVCAGDIPFHDYYQPAAPADDNTPHIMLTPGMLDFVWGYLAQSQNPTIEYNETLTGPRVVTTGSETPFSVSYSGPLTYLPYWSVDNAKGVSVTLQNAQTSECRVKINSVSPGESNPWFILRVRTAIRLADGRTICAGEKTHKVFVRPVAMVFGIVALCQVARPGSYLNFRSLKPSPDLVPAGLELVRAHWQISRYNIEEEFGNSAYDNCLIRSDLSDHTFPVNPPYSVYRNRVYYSGCLGTGGMAEFFVRIRHEYKMANPDFGQPGEPQFLHFFTSWRTSKTAFTAISNPTYQCPQFSVVGPDPFVKNINHDLELNLDGENRTFPVLVHITDARGLVVDRFQLDNPIGTHRLPDLKPAVYSVILNPGPEEEEYPLHIVVNELDPLSASPNPAFKETDTHVRVSLRRDPGFHEPFLLKLYGQNGQCIREEWMESGSADLDIRDLDPGSYVLSAEGEQTQLYQNLELGIQGKPYLMVSPNPATGQVNGEVFQPLSPDLEYRYTLTDKLGTVLKSGVVSSPFAIPIDELAPDLYYLHLSDGIVHFTRIIQKVSGN